MRADFGVERAHEHQIAVRIPLTVLKSFARWCDRARSATQTGREQIAAFF
jgi:hypothetical protein